MKHDYGNSICVSSQVGCNMGCKFCESGRRRKIRNLETYEMVLQILMIEKLFGKRISHVVVMGIGEPFDNYDNLIKFFRIINHPKGLAIGARHITVSTCGIVPNMRRLADEQLQITLALSLHAPSQEKRLKLMPVANKYPLHEVIEACAYYFAKTGRRITFEYSLVSGNNDHSEDADKLASLVRGLNCHINLIPVNPIEERDYVQSSPQTVVNFKNKLEKYGINVTIRREMGRDIDGACGQLRKRWIER